MPDLTPASLRERVANALDASIDRCARCKVCDAQIDAVMVAIAHQDSRPEAAQQAPLTPLRHAPGVSVPDRLDQVADWFDSDDEFKSALFPDVWPERGHEIQDDLREWAKLLRTGENHG